MGLITSFGTNIFKKPLPFRKRNNVGYGLTVNAGYNRCQDKDQEESESEKHEPRSLFGLLQMVEKASIRYNAGGKYV